MLITPCRQNIIRGEFSGVRVKTTFLMMLVVLVLSSAYLVSQCFGIAAYGVQSRDVASRILLAEARFVNISQQVLDQGFFVASVTLNNPNNETVEVTQLGVTLYQMEDFGFSNVASGSPYLPALLESGEREFQVEVHFHWNTTLKWPNYFVANFKLRYGLAFISFTCKAEDSNITTEGPFSAGEDPASSLITAYMIGLFASWVVGIDVFAVAFLYLKRRSDRAMKTSTKTGTLSQRIILAAFFALEGLGIVWIWFSYRIVSLLITPLRSEFMHYSGAGAMAGDLLQGIVALVVLVCFVTAIRVFLKGGKSQLGFVVCVFGIWGWGGTGLLGLITRLIAQIMSGDVATHLSTLPDPQTIAWATLFIAFTVGNLIAFFCLRKDRFSSSPPA